MTPEPLDPNKFHTLNKKSRMLAVLVGLAIVLVILPIIGYSYYKFAVYRPSQKTDETTIEVRGGESVNEIALKLFDADVINSEFLFKIYVIANRFENSLQAGVYVVPGGASVVEVTEQLMHGTNDKTITFIEGWRTEEFAELASKNFNKIDYANFVKAAKKYEGYLFPDTYSLSVNVTEERLVEILNNNFERKTKEILSDDALKEAGLTKEQAVIFASILEREINTDTDKPIVAGILIKRWKNGELIGADATTQYAIAASRYGCPYEGEGEGETTENGENSKVICPDAENILDINWWPHDLTVDELKLKNPYNTRAVVGLPPAPISNPGIASIKAVLNHQESEYNYYLTDNNGITRFARTLEEHNANVATYLN